MLELPVDDIRRLRLRAQRLHPRGDRGMVLDTLRVVCGIQAQSPPAMLLALRARLPGLTREDVVALGEARGAVRTWAMRSTLHLLPAADVRWLVSLLGPRFAAGERGRRLQLGLSDDLCERAFPAMREVLADDGPLTRRELAARLGAHGITVAPAGQAAIHLIHWAALAGLVCLGPDRADGEATYVLVDRWLAPQPSVGRDASLRELARRYLQGFAPASPRDLAGWSGLSLGDTRRAWPSAVGNGDAPSAYVAVRASGEGQALLVPASVAASLAEPPEAEPVARLLPAFDNLLLGYADRDLVVSPGHSQRVYHGGQVTPVVLVDGLAAGVWRYERRGRRLEIQVSLFAGVSDSVLKGIAEEADDVGRFFGSAVTLTYH